MRTNHTSDSDCARSFVILFVCDREHALAAHCSHSRGPRRSAADRIAALCVKTGDEALCDAAQITHICGDVENRRKWNYILYTRDERHTQRAMAVAAMFFDTSLQWQKYTHTHTYRSTESKSVLFFCV